MKCKKHKPIYICDSEKAIASGHCNGFGCRVMDVCKCTTSVRFSKKGENGKPIVALASDLFHT